MNSKTKSSSTVITKAKTSKDSNILQKVVSETKNEGSVNENYFSSTFRNYCLEHNAPFMPDVRTINQKDLNQEFSFCTLSSVPASDVDECEAEQKPTTIVPEVLVVQNNNNKIIQVIFKHFLVDKNMLTALKLTFKSFNTVPRLRLEFCGLRAKEIQTLQHILKQNPTISELSVNGNPNPNQNFYLLLKNTTLMSLSLRFCRIKESGIAAICEELQTITDQSLTHLNLSSNFLEDSGVEYVANALRVNRQLTFLNLADNQITNKGCISLMAVLTRFPLKLEEIIVRRHRILAALMKKYGMQELDFTNGAQMLYETIMKKSSGVHKNRDTIRTPESGSKFGRSSRTHTPKTDMDKFSEIELDVEPHPFVKDSFEENNEIICIGNFQLASLNLAYNKISYTGLQKVAEVLRYQIDAVGRVMRGLNRLVLEGNISPSCSAEMNEILKLMAVKNQTDNLSEKISKTSSLNTAVVTGLNNF